MIDEVPKIEYKICMFNDVCSSRFVQSYVRHA